MEQPILNIGMLGSVSDGKSTTVLKLSGIKTQKYSSELKRNITIKPGYANMKIFNNNGKLDSCNSNEILEGELVHHLSFVDCPGHYELIMAMLSNIQVMDGVILVVSASEKLSNKPQLLQHMDAIKIGGFNKVIVLFNKLDLITKSEAITRKKELDVLLKKYQIKPKIIIPTAINLDLGKENILNAILKYFPPKRKEIKKDPLFYITRSFNINKNNCDYKELMGGVAGGSLLNGKFKIGDEIEVRPGIIENINGVTSYKPLITKITSLQSDTLKLNEIKSGGLIGIGTNIDPQYTHNDYLSGNVVGLKGKLPEVYTKIQINYNYIIDTDTHKINENDILYLQIGPMNTRSKYIDNCFHLEKPTCINKKMIIIISKKINNKFNILAHGNLDN
jgi:translation initiation factor 2 subunit 3